MRDRFPQLVEWREEARYAARCGDLIDNGFGRKMRCDPERAHTQGIALVGQGCARDIMMTGILALPSYILPMLRAQVHDEIVLSVPIDQLDQVEADVMTALQFDWAPPGAAIQVPIEAGLAQRGANWAACYAK